MLAKLFQASIEWSMFLYHKRHVLREVRAFSNKKECMPMVQHTL